VTLMPDVNVLVYAHRQDEKSNDAYREWLEGALDGPEPVAMSVLVAIGFVRIVTNARIYADPTPLSVAFATIERLTQHPRCRVAAPEAGHMEQVSRLCRAIGAAGKQVADAQHAAVAISEGATWVTRDGDFARFEHHGLRWQHLVLG
jgi:toxin-antitoxin system PIN domain toxin